MVSYVRWPTTLVDALPLGCENNGDIYYCAVASTADGDVIPGKAKGDSCWCPYKGKEHVTKRFAYVKSTGKVTTKEDDKNGPPPHALMDGHEYHSKGVDIPYYAAIAFTKWGMVPGKADGRSCWFSYGGKEYQAEKFLWVIVASRVSITKTPTPLVAGRKFKYRGIIDETDFLHSISIHKDHDHTIAPHYYPLADGRKIPYYHETVTGTSTKYDPAGNCEGMFMSSNFQPNNNCYNYAVNIATNSFAQPGRMECVDPKRIDGSGDNVVRGALADGLLPVEIHPHEFLATEEEGKGHFVALLISKPDPAIGWKGDYHWVRCDNTWTGEQWVWSQKDGGDQVTNFDFAGHPIHRPDKANWAVNLGPCKQGGDDVVVVYDFKTLMYVPCTGIRII